MIDHASVSVSDPAVSKAFYEAALAPLGYRVIMEFGPVTGLHDDAVAQRREGRLVEGLRGRRITDTHRGMIDHASRLPTG